MSRGAIKSEYQPNNLASTPYNVSNLLSDFTTKGYLNAKPKHTVATYHIYSMDPLSDPLFMVYNTLKCQIVPIQLR